MVLGKDEFMKRLQERIGEDTSDEAMTFIEDMTDTYNDFESRTGDTEDWKTKYDELDKSWREKYKARFFEGRTTPEDVKEGQTDNVQGDGEEKTFEDLFEEREG